MWINVSNPLLYLIFGLTIQLILDISTHLITYSNVFYVEHYIWYMHLPIWNRWYIIFCHRWSDRRLSWHRISLIVWNFLIIYGASHYKHCADRGTNTQQLCQCRIFSQSHDPCDVSHSIRYLNSSSGKIMPGTNYCSKYDFSFFFISVLIQT